MMSSHAAFQHRIGIRMALSRADSLFTLIILLITCSTSAAQQQSTKISENLQQVETLVQQGRLDEAKTAILAELQRNPSSVDAYNLLGIAESDEQDYTDAITAFQKALQLAPYSTKTHNNLGNVYVAQKSLDLAENEFKTVLRLDPANRDANYNLGVVLLSKGDPTAAIPYFERVRPANIASRFNLISAYLRSKRTAEALQLAAALSSENKDNVQVHFTLGVLLASEKQYKPAQLELEKADALQPDAFEILYNLGQDLLRGSDFAKSELALNRALKVKPDSPETLYLLAQDYKNESRPLDALDLLLRAHKIAPENTDIIYLMAQVSMSQMRYPCSNRAFRSPRNGPISAPPWARAISWRVKSTRPSRSSQNSSNSKARLARMHFLDSLIEVSGDTTRRNNISSKDSSLTRTTLPACLTWVL